MESSKYLDVFIEESKDNLQTLNSTLLDLERDGFSEEGMNAAFRAMHTIKGTAGVIGITPIQQLAHVMEDLFDDLRRKKETPPRNVLELLFAGVDLIESMLLDLEASGATQRPVEDLVEGMRSVMGEAPLVEAVEQAPIDDAFTLEPEQLEQVRSLLSEGERPVAVIVKWSKGLKLKEGRAFQVVRALSSMGSLIATSPDTDDISDDDAELILVIGATASDADLMNAVKDITGVESATVHAMDMPGLEPVLPPAPQDDAPAQVEHVEERAAEHGVVEESIAAEQKIAEYRISEQPREDGNGLDAKESRLPSTGSSIRVKSKLLDQLLDLVGEIMINSIRINQIATDIKHRELKQTLQNNSRLMGEMQDIVLRMRMVQVDFIFKRFPRIVRDLSRTNGKDVDFIMRGNDIEIDRSLLDEIGDALVHLIRNSLDHGIEPPEERVAKGKNPRGTITLSATQEQSNIIISVEDDGRGMNPQTILAKAIAKGLIKAEDAERLDDRSKLQFVFLPGFSTAEKVSDISGRGVGMDVVKTKIEELGGSVRIDSTFGKGCKVTLMLPPSMSIIRAMLVEVNQEKYAIPLENVRETVRVPLDAIHTIVDRAVFQLRDEVLPVLNIRAEFGASCNMEGEMPAVIVEKNDNRACLLVSRLIGQQEIVVKNLGKDLRRTGYFSGATILGDGKVAMILDVGAFT
jgi:two-component system chemotaxis sensor kinase CheA